MRYSYTWLEYILFFNLKSERNISLKGKTILITGASYGIGEFLSYRLAKAGAHLLLLARSRSKLEDVKNKVESFGGSAEIFAFDLRELSDLEQFIEQQFSNGRKLDVLVNNAGKSIRRSIMDSMDRYHDSARCMAINFHSPVKLSLALIPTLLKSNGQIIQISSVNVLLPPFPFWSAYQASKVAFDQWFRSAAPELRAHGIAMTSMYLPLVKTRMVDDEQYKNYPKMRPEHSANLIFQKIVSRKFVYKPWWLPIATNLIYFLKPLVDFYIHKKIVSKRKSK